MLNLSSIKPSPLFPRVPRAPRGSFCSTPDWSLLKHFGPATFKIMLADQAHDRIRNLLAALFRRFYLVGVVGILVAHKSQINQRNTRQKRLPDYHVVESRQRGDRYFLCERFRYSRVIDRANSGRFLQAQNGSQHFAVTILELAGYVRQPIQNLSARRDLVLQNVRIQYSVVSARADDQMRRVVR